MKETAVVAFTTFFATIGPLDVGPVFAAITPRASPKARRRIQRLAAQPLRTRSRRSAPPTAAG